MWSSPWELSHLFYIFRLCRITLAGFSLLKRKTFSFLFLFSEYIEKKNFFMLLFPSCFILCFAVPERWMKSFSRELDVSSSSLLPYIFCFFFLLLISHFVLCRYLFRMKKRWKNNKRAAKKSRKFILDE